MLVSIHCIDNRFFIYNILPQYLMLSILVDLDGFPMALFIVFHFFFIFVGADAAFVVVTR